MNTEPAVKYIGDISEQDLIVVIEYEEEGLIKVDPKTLEEVKNGIINSQFKIAEIYLNKNFCHHAKAWCTRLSEKNYAPAQLMLGNMYGDDHLVISGKPGHDEAEKWFEKAYLNDPANIPHQVGIYYYSKPGLGNEAFKWFLKGAMNGNEVSQYWVGLFYNRDTYYSGGVAEDKTKAFEWFKKSADQGYQSAIQKVKELKKDG